MNCQVDPESLGPSPVGAQDAAVIAMCEFRWSFAVKLSGDAMLVAEEGDVDGSEPITEVCCSLWNTLNDLRDRKWNCLDRVESFGPVATLRAIARRRIRAGEVLIDAQTGRQFLEESARFRVHLAALFGESDLRVLEARNQVWWPTAAERGLKGAATSQP